MADTLNLLPCPIPGCIGDIVGMGRLPCGVSTVGCGRCGLSVPATDDESAEFRWNALARRASSAAAAPEGVLPPLPKCKMLVGHHLDSLHVLYSAEQVREIQREAYEAGRAAVEADRAQQYQAGHMPPFAAPAGQHDAGIAVLSALRDGIPLEEPVNITKAVLAQREARVVLSGGKGPAACVMLVNIQLTGWADGPEKAEAWASGYNTAFKWYRGALIDLANKVSADAASRCRAEGGDGTPEAGDVSADRAQQGEPHDDDIAWEHFASATKAKMAEGREKGRGGWEDPEQCPTERLQLMLLEHLKKGDPVDVANFCMMLWTRGEPVVAVDLKAARQAVLEDAAAICDNFAKRDMHPAECAGAIRMMKDSIK